MTTGAVMKVLVADYEAMFVAAWRGGLMWAIVSLAMLALRSSNPFERVTLRRYGLRLFARGFASFMVYYVLL